MKVHGANSSLYSVRCNIMLKKIAVFLVFVMMSVSNPSSLFSQVLFEVPDTTPNYTGYRYLEECAAALDRIYKDSFHSSKLWMDTARINYKLELMTAYPEDAIKAGKACVKNKNIDTIQRTIGGPIARTLLLIGSEKDAKQLYDRLYEGGTSEERVKLAIEWMNIYADARPMRLEAMKTLYQNAKLEPWADTADGVMLELGAILARSAWVVGDTLFAMSLGKEVIERNEKLTLDQRNYGERAGGGWNLDRTIYIDRHVYRFVYGQALVDSLIAGHTALRGWHLERLKRVFGDTIAINGNRYWNERRFPQLTGDFMFKSKEHIGADGLMEYVAVPKEERSPVPESGKINMIVSLQAGCNMWTNNISTPPGNDVTHRSNKTPQFCFETISQLRRIKEKFPEVDLTIITRTYGTVGRSAPLTPEQEADTLAKYFLGFLKVPGRLLIENTPWIKLPGNPLDLRRVDLPTPNQDSLQGFSGVSAQHLRVHVLDADGKMFFDSEGFFLRALGPELRLEEEIAAVLRRKPKQGITGQYDQ